MPEAEAVAAAANFHHAGQLREVLHPTTAPRPASQVIEALRDDPQHAPAYYLVAHAWIAAFGNSVPTVRLLSALIGILAIPCMYWLCVELFGSSGAGWIGAALVATAPIDVLYAQEAREYSLWLVSILISSALLLRALGTPSAARWVGYSLSVAASFYVFPLSAFVILAHFMVALGAKTSARNRWYACGAMLVGFLLFAPWMALIVAKMSDINASLGSIVDSAGPRTQTLLKAAALLRLEIIDLNGAHRLLVLGLWLPILALLLFALYQTRRRMLVWLLPLCAALPLIGMDLLLGGHRTETPRYFIPMFLGLDLALAGLFAWALIEGVSPRLRTAAGGLFALLMVARMASCAASLHSSTWWNSYNIRSREVAALINKSHRPLLLSDDYVLWPLTLSEYLDPTVEVALRPHCYQCKVPAAAPSPPNDVTVGEGGRDLFLLVPSAELQKQVKAQAESKPQTSIKCINVRASCVDGIELFAANP